MNNEQLSMNKKRGIYFIPFFFLISSFLFLTGCGNSLASDKASSIPDGQGSFSLTLSPGRTILPDAPALSDCAVFNLVFTPTGTGSEANFDRIDTDLSSRIFLNPGTYNLVVNAYKDSEKTKLLARGTLNGIVITANQNTTKSVTLEALHSEGTGTFSWDITVPSGVTTMSMIIAPADEGGTEQQTATTLTGNLTLNAGLYNLTITLKKTTGQSVIWKELLYVYQNLDSSFTFEFTNAHFNQSSYTVTFNSNSGSNVGDKSALHGGTVYKPVAPTKVGYDFLGWYKEAALTNKWNFATDIVTQDTTLYAKWGSNALTEDGALDVVYLQDGAAAIYKFNIGSGTLADYNKISFDFKISEAGLAIWKDAGIRHLRLYGVYDGTETSTTDSNDVKILNLANYNAPYILKDPAQNDIDTIRDSVTANTWKTVEYTLSAPYYAGNTAHLPGTQTGIVYFGLGISCLSTNEGKNRDQAFLQLIKNVQLHPVSAGTPVNGAKPDASEAQFVAWNTSIVFEWRGDPATEITNPPLPELPAETFNRGNPPANADLREVVLSASGPGFTYINGGSLNDRGWASPGGSPTNQSYSGAAGTVAFDKFKKAWYLVLETTTRPTGTVQLVWMGSASGWSSNAVSSNIGEPIEGALEIVPGNPNGYVLKFFLPKALFQYGKFYQTNANWAAFCVQYNGANGANLNNLGITRAYFLVDKNDL